MDNVAKEMEHLHKLAVADQEKRFQKLWDNMISETWLTPHSLYQLSIF
jgi:hypothetical protein